MNETSGGAQPNVEHVLIDLLASFLATNGVGIATGFSLSQQLLDTRVVSIEKDSGLLISLGEEAIFSAITSSSYPRGQYVSRLVANRIFRSLEQINSQGGSAFLRLLSAASASDIRSHLLPLYGVGNKFITSYLLLAGIGES
jgi:hypothetical protein